MPYRYLDEPQYGPDALFWRIDMGHGISLFGVKRTSHEQNFTDEEESRQIQAYIHHARYFQERIQILDRVLVVPAPHSESILARLPRNTNPCPMAKIRASTDGYPPHGETSRNLGQTSNSVPAVLNSRSISTHPILSMTGGKPSVPVAYVPSNDGGKPPA